MSEKDSPTPDSREVESTGEIDFGRLRKLREDSKWNQLTGDERERLDSWLFEENLGYAKIVARAKTEFDIETTTTSMFTFPAFTSFTQ